MMDNTFMFAFDLEGKEWVVTIDRVEAGELTSQGGRKTKKPIVYFRGAKKPLAFNTTNCQSVVSLYGSNDTSTWIGKKITIYPTVTQMGGKEVDCIRIKPIKHPIPNGVSTTDPADTESDA